MATAELHPGDVYRQGAFVDSGWWSDNDDATFITLLVSEDATFQSAHGWIPPYTGPAVSAITLHVRIAVASAEVASTLPLLARVVFAQPGGAGAVPFTDVAFDNLAVPNDGAWHDLTSPASYGTFGLGIDEVVARLRGGEGTSAGLRAIYFATSPGVTPPPHGVDRLFSISEAWLELTLAPTAAPPCQLYPRDDDQGVGSGAIWPAPSSGQPGGYY